MTTHVPRPGFGRDAIPPTHSLAETLLIRSGRTALHRRLGVAGAVLAAAEPVEVGRVVEVGALGSRIGHDIFWPR